MLADKDSSIINEPLLARHARYMHTLARKAFRTKHMRDFNQVQAAAVLRSAHERRATDVKSLGGPELMRDIAMEDIRRSIHNTYVSRCSVVLVVAFLVALFGSYSAYSWAWNNSDDLKTKFAQLRGYEQPEEPKTLRAKAASKLSQAKSAAQEKYESWKDKNPGKDPLESIRRWGNSAQPGGISNRVSFKFLSQAQSPSKEGRQSKKDGLEIDPNNREEAFRKVYAKAVELAQKRAELFKKAFGVKPENDKKNAR